MLPEFPNFKSIELSDKGEIEKLTQKFPPYSDFNFVSLWSWDIKGEMRLSVLNGNLVVRFTDYVTGEPFYSFLGENDINDTVEKLLELSKAEKLKPILKLVPEITIKNLDLKRYGIEEDPDNFDYIYKNEDLANFSGKKFQNKRNLCNKFKLLYPNARILISSRLDEELKNDILTLDKKWAHTKGEKIIDFDVKNEIQAVDKFIVSIPALIESGTKFIFCCLYVDKQLVGFSISSIINEEYVVCHFTKGDIDYQGVYEYMLKNCGGNLIGVAQFMNYEQDLGIPSLRFSKNSFRPTLFLKKYVVVKS